MFCSTVPASSGFLQLSLRAHQGDRGDNHLVQGLANLRTQRSIPELFGNREEGGCDGPVVRRPDAVPFVLPADFNKKLTVFLQDRDPGFLFTTGREFLQIRCHQHATGCAAPLPAAGMKMREPDLEGAGQKCLARIHLDLLPGVNPSESQQIPLFRVHCSV